MVAVKRALVISTIIQGNVQREKGLSVIRSSLRLYSAHCAGKIGFYCIAAIKKDAVVRPADIIHLSFSATSHAKALEQLQDFMPGRICGQDRLLTRRISDLLESFLDGDGRVGNRLPDSPFIEAGTEFQQRVWRLIAAIPYGSTRSYGSLAGELGNVALSRAVGQACKVNPIGLIIPCHRVVAADGLGGFAGGATLKQRLLALESRRQKE